MSPVDLRVPLDPILEAFGLPATVTRPSSAAVSTTVVWLPTPLNETQPYGRELNQRDPRRLMAVTRNDTLTTMPKGTLVSAAEALGGAAKTWQVEGIDRVDADCWRVVVRET